MEVSSELFAWRWTYGNTGHTVLVVVRQAYQVMSLTREASRLSDGYDRVSSGFDPIHFGPTLFKMQKRN